MNQIESVEISQPTDDSEGCVIFSLTDGRTVSVPLNWSWRLANASGEERLEFEIGPARRSVHWPAVDEDISIDSVFHGGPATESQEAGWEAAPEYTWTPRDILHLRNLLGDTQEEFADRLNTRQATISAWENGRQIPQGISVKALNLLNEKMEEEYEEKIVLFEQRVLRKNVGTATTPSSLEDEEGSLSFGEPMSGPEN